MRPLLALLFLACALPVRAQFELVLMDGAPAPPVYDLGPVYSGQTAAAHFRLRNSSNAPATLTTLSVAGAGFSLSAPAVPLGIAAQASIDLTVSFAAIDTGNYSAALHAGGIAILVTAAVVPSLTCRTDGAAGLVPLTALDFGSVVRGTAVQRRVTLRNETQVILTVPPISVDGAGFSLSAALPSGQSLQPQQGGEFTVVFTPPSPGAYPGTLLIGDRAFPLSGTAVDPPLPNPSLAIDLQPAASARQGSLIVHFDAPAQASGAGAATIDFQGPPDPAIAFAAGGRSTTFSVSPGDTQAVLPFQTGTTAGTLSFHVQLGQSADQQSLTIAAAQPALTATQALRSQGAVEIRVTGFDNTRTLGALAFTFYDASGKTLASIPANAAADFANFFAASDLGGVFLLRAVFPITGDASQVASCDVSLTNAAGATTQRIPLP